MILFVLSHTNGLSKIWLTVAIMAIAAWPGLPRGVRACVFSGWIEDGDKTRSRTGIMDIDEVLHNLCLYDSRHPLYADLVFDDEDRPVPRAPGCACDNCFYGRDRLAVALLEALEARGRMQGGNRSEGGANNA